MGDHLLWNIYVIVDGNYVFVSNRCKGVARDEMRSPKAADEFLAGIKAKRNKPSLSCENSQFEV
jgi:hypothetical protein